MSSYRETITESFQRLDDKVWSGIVQTSPPAEVEWMTALVQH